MFEFTFLDENLGPHQCDYLWTDEPFVGTVFCTRLDKGFETDWWVSGTTWKDEKPRLMLRLRLSVDASEAELKGKLEEIWSNNLVDLAYGSAVPGGINDPSIDQRDLTISQKNFLFERQLHGHMQLHSFNIKGDSKVERTANMYLLLKSFGSTQPQKAIAAFESKSFVHDVLPSAINQRLAMARKAGFLPGEAKSSESNI